MSPNVFYPSVYVAHANPTMHFAGAILQSVDHVVPVPATQPAKIVMQFMHRWRIGGRTVTTRDELRDGFPDMWAQIFNRLTDREEAATEATS